ncbi:MAG: hypothetical protein OJF55_001012 [Rhodanobacteraceae bacterium]|nr:MAG: hypothetical protein OJF55_001012 [Rhodanobacteraceae bacterium]
MPRRLIALFDGTWNKVKTHTNVERFWRLVATADAAGNQQVCKYVAGVGVAPGMEHLLGGAFGLGLSDNVKEGFQWLSQQWRTGDEIWLFGFSRGAYTARSLGGLIRKCGLLKPDAKGGVATADVDNAYALYRNDLHPDDPQMVAFRAAHSREVQIRFIGVWDTVGALGIPGVASWFPFSRSRYSFHDTELSKIVQYAYQALALDEHRADFAPTKWTRPAASLAPGESPTAWKPEQVEVEQRWFAGAHSDIGGGEKTDGAGHSPDTLPEIALAWMQAKAAGAGLAFKETYMPAPGAELGVPNNSYADFMAGVYRWFKPPFERVLGGGVNETIDSSVWMKWSAQSVYRPPSIETAMQAGLIDLGSSRVA